MVATVKITNDEGIEVEVRLSGGDMWVVVENKNGELRKAGVVPDTAHRNAGLVCRELFQTANDFLAAREDVGIVW